MSEGLEAVRREARRNGFTLLLASAGWGFALEVAHALKLSAYLDVPLRRELWTWAHAHGVGLALVLLAYAACGVVEAASAGVLRVLTAGCLLVPLGFLAGGFGLHESDPGVAILLVPIGALCVIRALWTVTRIAWTQR